MRLLLALLLALLAPPARAQEGAAAIAADRLTLTADGTLVIEGDVQAFYEGATLTARRVVYDRRTDTLSIEGPILLRDAEGNLLSAESATLDPRLRDGLLRGVRLVLDRRLQIAANRLDRQGPLSSLTGAAATSCQVCPGRAPLWEIRAEQVIRDEAAGQLWFRNARFLVRGVPLLWVPRLRLPDPANDRATGLLVPRLRNRGELGFGIELPYFVVLGPDRDLTLYPSLSIHALSLGARYRQAFANGGLELRGAVSRDDLGRDGPRGFAAAEGAFRLPGGFDLAFDATAVSDDDYPADYGLSSEDRIESLLLAARVSGPSLFEAELVHTRALEEGVDAPPLQGRLAWERRAVLAGGWLTWGASADAVGRPEGRDQLRAGAFAEWRRTEELRFGLVAETAARGALDAWRVAGDPAEGSVLRATPAVQATLRWPLLRRGAGGVSDLLEPVVSVGWTGAPGGDPPNEDALLPTLDAGNLHALSRLPGEDAAEGGARLAVGLAWTREAPGLASTLSFGRLLRAEPLDASATSGLSGRSSDWLVQGRLDLGGLSFDARALFDDALSPRTAEARLDWTGARGSLGAAFLRLPADPVEDRPRPIEELSLEGDWRVSERWSFSGEARLDLARDRLSEVGLGVVWRNECVEVDVAVGRSYTGSGDGDPSTEFGLSVDLLGFSAGDGARARPGACRG